MSASNLTDGFLPSQAQLAEADQCAISRLSRGFSTEAIDHQLFTRTIAELYQLAGHRIPMVIFCQSPFAVCTLGSVLAILARSQAQIRSWSEFNALIEADWWHEIVDTLRKQSKLTHLLSALKIENAAIRSRLSPTRAISLWSQLLFQSEVHATLGARVESQLTSELGKWCRPHTATMLGREAVLPLAQRITLLRAQIQARLRIDSSNSKDVIPKITGAFQNMAGKLKGISASDVAADGPAFIGQQPENVWWCTWEASWPIRLLALYDVLGHSFCSTQTQRLLEFCDGLMNNSFACIFMDGLCIASERPVRLSLDDQHRLHDEQQSAIAFADGYSIYSWKGVTVPAYAIRQPQAITVKIIYNQANSEVRRALIDIYGPTRYLVDSGAKLIQEDSVGALYLRTLPGDEALVMVKVVNSSPEPDGTYKDYFIRVPPTITTARDAVAWTFAIEPETYVLAKQT